MEIPQLKNFVHKLFDARYGKTTTPQKTQKGNVTGNRVDNMHTPNRLGCRKEQLSETINHGTRLKSPSDTTVYAPAVSKAHQFELGADKDIQQQPVVQSNLLNVRQRENSMGSGNDCINDQISRFVEQIRLQSGNDEDNDVRIVQPSLSAGVEADETRRKAEATVIEAEKFRAVIATPTGNFEISNPQIVNKVPMQNIPNIGGGVSDDDFFHLVCHIEPNLIHKIENGEFIELEKLLPKSSVGNVSAGRYSDETRLEWVQHDGNTFLVSANSKESKTTNVRRWEQAFWVYATIYCTANPQRSKEIWQYISVINTAAGSYVWENVYNYDITFRHLMAFNPQRSWAVTYNQMWNLSMRDPLPRNQFNRGNQNFANQTKFCTGGGQNSGKRRKSDYCWNYNKGVKCKFGAKCRFIERCSYCDAGNHSLYNCPKKKAADDNESANKGNASATAGSSN